MHHVSIMRYFPRLGNISFIRWDLKSIRGCSPLKRSFYYLFIFYFNKWVNICLHFWQQIWWIWYKLFVINIPFYFYREKAFIHLKKCINCLMFNKILTCYTTFNEILTTCCNVFGFLEHPCKNYKIRRYHL